MPTKTVPLWWCYVCEDWWYPSPEFVRFWLYGEGEDPDEGTWGGPVCPSCAYLYQKYLGLKYDGFMIRPDFRRYRNYGEWARENF